MDNFKSFITEQKEEPYRFVVVYNDAKNVGDDSLEETEPLARKMLSFGKKLGGNTVGLTSSSIIISLTLPIGSR